MRKLHLLTGVLAVLGYSTFAQTLPDKCGTHLSISQREATNPGIRQQIWQAEHAAREWQFQNKRSATESIVVPVVFHVVYKLAAENIPDSLIMSQLAVLNADFGRTNSDAANTRPIFDSISVNTGIQFCLASTDPNGQPTSGITRTLTTKDNFDPLFGGDMNAVKAAATGGVDPWPRDSYLNIWVCNMAGIFGVSVLGFAQFPGEDPATDGVVIHYEMIGNTGNTVAGAASHGRTSSHEVGHWFGLRHIWGDGDNPLTGAPGNCDSSDYALDTPVSNQRSQFNCDHNRNSCSNEDGFWTAAGVDPPDMVENYMDYSNDECMNAFTRSQAERMWSFINTARVSLKSSNGCEFPLGVQSMATVQAVTPVPNPSNSGVVFRGLSGVFRYRVIDLLGQTIESGTHQSEADLTLDVSHLKSGAYMLIGEGDTGQNAVRFVRQ